MAQRLAATVMRRTHHRDGAQRLMLDTARQLAPDTGLPDAATSAMYGQLLAAASYTAAMRDDRDTAWGLLGEAEDAARRVGAAKADRFNMLNLAVYKISVSRVLGDYRHRRGLRRVVGPASGLHRRFEVVPGAQAQVDWGDEGTILPGGVRVYSFHMVLSYSRDPFCCYTTSMNGATWWDCHRRAFAHFGGVPAAIVYDRTKSIVKRHVRPGVTVPLHPDAAAFADHYGFTPMC